MTWFLFLSLVRKLAVALHSVLGSFTKGFPTVKCRQLEPHEKKNASIIVSSHPV